MPAAKSKTLELKIVGGPHNGTAPFRQDDPVAGDRIGGQVLYIRTACRKKRLVAPMGRRWGKTTLRPFLWMTEAMMTTGQYTVGYATANHVKAWETFQFCRDQFGPGVVKAAVGEPESQNRYLDLLPLNLDVKDLPNLEWMARDPVLGPRLHKNLGKNTGSRIYFWSGAHPHYQAIQGFTFPFDRISLDECQQLHPGITRIVNPMLLDSGGALDCTGIADIDAIGNVWFEDYFQKGLEEAKQHRWASLNFPTHDNPKLNQEALAEIEEDVLTNDDYEQYILARFVSGTGAVFTNLKAIFVLKPVFVREHPSHTNFPEWVGKLFAAARSDQLLLWIYESDRKPGRSYAMTIDFAGRTRTRDATVIGVYDMTENRQVFLAQIRDMTSPNQLAWIEGVKDHYDAQEVHGDNTPEGAALMAYLRERYSTGVRGHNFSDHNKAEYVKRGMFLFEMGEVQLIDCPAQRKEFKDYKRIAGESKMGKDQAVTYSHPPGKHDDFVSAFLQIAPSMAHGKRAETKPEPDAKPVFEPDHSTTSLERFAEGLPLPWREPSDASWDDVVVPR